MLISPLLLVTIVSARQQTGQYPLVKAWTLDAKFASSNCTRSQLIGLRMNSKDPRTTAVLTAMNNARKAQNFTNPAKIPNLVWNQNLANCATMSMAGYTSRPEELRSDLFFPMDPKLNGSPGCQLFQSIGTVTRYSGSGSGQWGPPRKPDPSVFRSMVTGMMGERSRCYDNTCCVKSKTAGEVQHYTQIVWAKTRQVGCGYGVQGIQCWFQQGNYGLDLCKSTTVAGPAWPAQEVFYVKPTPR